VGADPAGSGPEPCSPASDAAVEADSLILI